MIWVEVVIRINFKDRLSCAFNKIIRKITVLSSALS